MNLLKSSTEGHASSQREPDYQEREVLHVAAVDSFDLLSRNAGLLVKKLPVAATIGAVAVPLVVGEYNVTLLTLVGIYAIAVLGLILFTGAAGVVSFGQAAFMGLGAYTSAYLNTRYNVDPMLGLVTAIIACGALSLLLGVITLHLGGHFLPITTLAWGVALSALFGTSQELGAHGGIRDIRAISLLGFSVNQPLERYYLVLTFLVVLAYVLQRYLNSSRGRAVRALRGGKTMMESLGYRPNALKLEAFVICAIFAGISGWLYAHTQAFISPSTFDLTASMNLLFMGVMGGLSSILGAPLGSAIFMYAKSLLQDALNALPGAGANYEIVLFGVLFILALRYMPKGVINTLLPGANFRTLSEKPHRDLTENSLYVERGDIGREVAKLRVENLVRRFGGLVAVSNVSFSVGRGEVVSLIGPNGAGKTTTFNAISNAVKATSGEVYLDGECVTKHEAFTLIRRGLGRTFQHAKLRPNMSVYENIALGIGWKHAGGALSSALGLGRRNENEVNARACGAAVKTGLDSYISTRAGDLPLGKQRIVEIARALTSSPGLLMLDEPAAGLRALEKDELKRLLLELKANGVSILIVEHDVKFVSEISDRVVVLNFGQKIFDGSPADMLKDKEVRNAYLG